MSEYIQVAFDKIIQTRVYTAIVLKSQELRFAIYCEPSTGRLLQMHMAHEERPRPSTHSLMSQLFSAIDMRIKQVLINDVEDTLFFSRIFLEQPQPDYRHIIEIDARPSDAITLAFFHNAPLFCTQNVLEKIVPFME